MTYIVQGNVGGKVQVSSEDFKYSYPLGKNFKPDSELHGRLLTMLLEMANTSKSVMSRRYPQWEELDKTLTAFIRIDEDEMKVVEADERRPTSIVLPYSFAILETHTAYLGSVFFQNPIFQYSGVSHKDVYGAMLLESLVQQHCMKNKTRLRLLTWFRDALTYGIGALIPTWTAKNGYEGTELINIDPFRFFPDVNVSLDNIQDAQYVGYVRSTNYNALLSREENGEYFNVKYLSQFSNGYSKLLHKRTDAKTGITEQSGTSSRINQTDVLCMYVTLIPAEYGLSKNEYPEKWYFEVAADSVIIKAEKLNLAHQMYPIVVIAPESNGYSNAAPGRIEVTYGMQHTIDFLFNSHMTNVRKAINDMLIVDPFMINMSDIMSPKPGKLVRLRKPAWGRGVKDAVMQLGVSDITRTNIQDAEWVSSLMQKVSGSDDSMMGMMRQGGPDRMTATESQNTRMGTSARMGKIAQVISEQGMLPLGDMIAHHMKQFYQSERFVKVESDWIEKLRDELGVVPRGNKVMVTPKLIDVDFDLEIRDGTTAGAQFTEALLRVYQYTVSNPEVMQQIDVFKLFSHIAVGLGVKNISEFKKSRPINTNVMPDDQVQREVAAGNLIPHIPEGGFNG